MEQEKIPREKIAVVTGDQKELDGINLFARDCQIDFVITVEALKEGWDCSFAYVFCSVATVNSKKDVEQILGRVLRMPYAKRRKDAELNRAYAHVSRASWPNAVKQLHDRLVDMGFEDSEADAFIEKVPQLRIDRRRSETLFAEAPPPTVIELAEDLSAFALSPEEQAAVTIEKTEQGSRVTFTGNVAEATVTRFAAAVKSAETRANLEGEASAIRPSGRLTFACATRRPFLVPQLCFKLDGALELADKDAFLDARGWSLLDYPAEISEADFRLTETGVQWEIDLSAAGKITEKAIGKAEQYDLDLVDTGWTASSYANGWSARRGSRTLRSPSCSNLSGAPWPI